MTKPIEPRLSIIALHGVADSHEEIDAGVPTLRDLKSNTAPGA
jgi:hypothetical protein